MYYFLIMLLFIFLIAPLSHASDKQFPLLSGPYLGQPLPGLLPESFAAGMLSTPSQVEINSVFSHDGTEFYYVIREKTSSRYDLMVTKLKNNIWSAPKRFPIAGEYSAVDITLSPDGNRLYFCTDMPSPLGAIEGYDIWYSDRSGDGWSKPVHAGPLINSPKGETQPSFTQGGDIYFPSQRKGSTANSVDLYVSKFIQGKYQEPTALPATVNSKYNEGNSFIAPDGSYILFSRWNMPKSIDGGKALYISFKKPDGTWTIAKNTLSVLGRYGSLAALSPDGKYLFYSTKEGIYWMDARIINQLKPPSLHQ